MVKSYVECKAIQAEYNKAMKTCDNLAKELKCLRDFLIDHAYTQRIYKRRIISGIDLIFITLIYTGLVFIGVGDWDGEISINFKASR